MSNTRLLDDAAAGREIVDITEIATRLGVPKNTVNVWRTRGVLPEPDLALTVGPVWYWATIETWAQKTGRLKVST